MKLKSPCMYETANLLWIHPKHLVDRKKRMNLSIKIKKTKKSALRKVLDSHRKQMENLLLGTRVSLRKKGTREKGEATEILKRISVENSRKRRAKNGQGLLRCVLGGYRIPSKGQRRLKHAHAEQGWNGMSVNIRALYLVPSKCHTLPTHPRPSCPCVTLPPSRKEEGKTQRG